MKLASDRNEQFTSLLPYWFYEKFCHFEVKLKFSPLGNFQKGGQHLCLLSHSFFIIMIVALVHRKNEVYRSKSFYTFSEWINKEISNSSFLPWKNKMNRGHTDGEAHDSVNYHHQIQSKLFQVNTAYQEPMNTSFTGLPNTVNSTDCLCFNSWIEEGLNKNDMLCFQEVKAICSMLN